MITFLQVGDLNAKTLAESRVQPSVSKKFDPTLSGLRGLAAFGVMIFHATKFLGYPINTFTSTFYLGVPIFLMMSMYLLLNRLDANRDLKRYFKRRVLRIWPIYYGCLVIFDILFRIPFWDFLRYLFFLEYYVNPFGFFPVTIFWTLQLEEAAYLLIPLIHRFPRKDLLGWGLILGGFAYLASIAPTPLSNHPMVYLQIYLPVPLIAYGFGILVYEGRIPGATKSLGLIGIFGFTLVNLLLTWSVTIPSFEANITNVLLYAISLTGFAGILASPPRFLRAFTLIGEESYALYAIHYAMVMIFGLVGILYALLAALLIEFSLRPKEVARRLLIAYSRPKKESLNEIKMAQRL